MWSLGTNDFLFGGLFKSPWCVCVCVCPCPTLTKIILCPPFQGILTVFDKLNSSIITVRQLDHSQTIISGGSPLTIPIPFSMVSAWCQHGVS